MENEFDLSNELQLFKKSAEKGYNLANRASISLNNSLTEAQNKIRETIEKFKQHPCTIFDVNQSLIDQLKEIDKSFGEFSKKIDKDLNKLKNDSAKFSITLFGRTMAGKSTLMEILKNGDGKSIGKGSQRTTRDVRSYEWNNLTITDVPGIGAFGGKQDEEKAIESAKKADLIFFLLTDDAPQYEEAKFFQTVIEIGKPVIGIINVKSTINENEDLSKNFRRIERDIKKALNFKRLDEIKNQFCKYSAQSGQEWSKIPFVYVHLKSAFIAQSKKIDYELAIKFKELSQINRLKDTIIKQVKQKGEFYRMKKFVDTILVPMLDSFNLLINWSYINTKNAHFILGKKEKLEYWLNNFDKQGNREIDICVEKIKSKLNREADIFVEDNFRVNNANIINNRWNKILEENKIEDICNKQLKNLNEESKEKLNDIVQEFNNELALNNKIFNKYSFNSPNFQDKKRIWNWVGLSLTSTTGILSLVGTLGGASVGALAGLATPLGWISLGIAGIFWIGSYFFKNREKAEREAKDNLSKQLKESINKICIESEEKMKPIFNEQIIKNISNVYVKDLNSLHLIVLELSNLQKNLAWKINKHILEMNESLIIEVIKLIGAEGLQYHLKEVARIPNNIDILLLPQDTQFPETESIKIKKLMGETVYFLNDCNNKFVLTSNIIKIGNKDKTFYKQRYNMQKQNGFIYIDFGNNINSYDEKILDNRIQLAEQLTEFLIRKK